MSVLVEESSARTRCVLAGWWWKNVRSDESGALHGAESWLGWVTAWDLFQKKTIAPYDGDELGMTDPWFEREQPTRYTDKHSSHPHHRPGLQPDRVLRGPDGPA